jgi:hypothetical protein
MAGRWGALWTVRVLGSGGLLAAFLLVLRGRVRDRALLATALLSALVVLMGTSANGHAWTTSDSDGA